MRLSDGRRLYTAHAEFGLNEHQEDAPHFIVQSRIKLFNLGFGLV